MLWSLQDFLGPQSFHGGGLYVFGVNENEFVFEEGGVSEF